ncbi:hypothetical protein [Jannaschia formosa]|uniref:hypothetical protein n=1 Tax=Jannaschia formosa TaxID=2259592 RepID=UPI001074FF8A|nr:hypothetical protein [Jannaschia formosa]TFL20021.1 hypothetical protein DR046_01345 [Jannaschia formosa]
MTSPTVANAPNPRDDGNPSLTALSDGRIAIGYQSRRPDGAFDVVLRIREADGSLGPEYRPEGDWSRARDTEAAELSDGSLMMTWLAETRDANGRRIDNIMGQRLSDSGTALSPVVALDSRPASQGRYEDNSIGTSSSGFSVTAVASGQKFHTRFDTNDVLVPGGNSSFETSAVVQFGFLPPDYATRYYGAEYPLDIRLRDYEITRLADGDMIATVLQAPSGAPYGGGVKRYWNPPEYAPLHLSFASDPDAVAIPVVEDSRTMGIGDFAVVALPDGGFVVTWAVGGGVHAQLFDEDGGHRGDNFRVATTDLPAPRVAVVAVSEDEIMFAWPDSPAGNRDVFFRTVPVETLDEGIFTQQELPFLEAKGEITGDPLEGATLRLSGSVESNYAIESTSLQWFRSKEGGGSEAIEGATGLRFTPGAEEVGKRISVAATIEIATGQTRTEWVSLRDQDDPWGSAATIENVPDPAEGSILIAGLPYVGRALTARPEITDKDGIPEDAFLYQWFRGEQPIAGAFMPRYRATAEDLGNELSVRVSFVDAQGALERIGSQPISVVTGPTEGDDVLIGGAGDGRITGLGGDDRLDGGIGNDVLTGGEGADIFVFTKGHEMDRIADFTPGQDRVEFGFDGIGGAGQLLREAQVRQAGPDVVIDFGEGDVLTLIDIQRGDLSASDAIFA